MDELELGDRVRIVHYYGMPAWGIYVGHRDGYYLVHLGYGSFTTSGVSVEGEEWLFTRDELEKIV